MMPPIFRTTAILEKCCFTWRDHGGFFLCEIEVAVREDLSGDFRHAGLCLPRIVFPVVFDAGAVPAFSGKTAQYDHSRVGIGAGRRREARRRAPALSSCRERNPDRTVRSHWRGRNRTAARRGRRHRGASESHRRDCAHTIRSHRRCRRLP